MGHNEAQMLMYGVIPMPVTRRCPRRHKKYSTLAYVEWIEDKLCDPCKQKDEELEELRRKLREHREPTTHECPETWKR